MLKSFVCELNIHRLFRCHYCYLANLLRGSSALQDGPVGRTALASRLEHEQLNEALGMQRDERCSHTCLPQSTLQSLPSPAAAFLCCILERFVVGSPKASFVELLFESVWALQWRQQLLLVWNLPWFTESWLTVQKLGVQISHDQGAIVWLMIPMVNHSGRDLHVSGKCLPKEI